MNNICFNLVGNAAVLKQVNTVRVLNLLRLGGPCSRAELARATGLDAKTITNVCNALLKKKLIVIGEAVAQGRGRPAEQVALAADAAFSIGVDIGASHISGVLIDLKGTLRSEWRKEIEVYCQNSSAIVESIQECVGGLLKSLGQSQQKKLVGIGICVPGFIDRDKKMSVDSVNIKSLQNFAFETCVEKTFGYEIFLEEASRAMALAERWFGGYHQCGNFIVVDMGFGIGVGIVQDGLAYRGAHESSGEIGHTVVEPYGRRCECGKQGCLETIASGHTLHDMAKRLEIESDDSKSHGGIALYKAALSGNKAAADELAKAGHYIGIAIANVINLFDPAEVILSGGLTAAGDMIIGPLRNAVKAHTVERFSSQYEVKVSTLGLKASALGAAMLPLRHYFEFENIRF